VLIPGPLRPATFLERPNRFLALARVGQRTARVHIPNPGRLEELLVPGCEVYVRAHGQSERRTAFDLVLVPAGDALVSIDSRLPPHLLEEALWRGRARVLGKPRKIQREVVHGASRFDLLVTTLTDVWWVEVKSCTLVVDGVALFPDAPTVRGARHVWELAQLAQAGGRAAIVFIIQRPDARSFRPFQAADPTFAAALRSAAAAGVAVHAYCCAVSLGRIEIARKLSVRL